MVQPETELLTERFEIHGFGDTSIAACLDDALLFRDHRVRRHR
jgi:hypothetical protein